MKNYILDTNVLLHDPHSLLNFKDNAVLIPIEVIEEIDRFKRESSELGQNARAVSRSLDELRKQGALSDGVPLANGGSLKIVYEHKHNGNGNGNGGEDAPKFSSDSVDNRILTLAFQIKKKSKAPTILVSKDINLRIKADAIGLKAEDYETDRVHLKDLYAGTREFPINAERLAAFRANGEVEANGGHSYYPNEYCSLVVKACGASSRATASSTLRLMPCSMTVSSSSRSWARRAREKP
jgi:PhoH-like ATPase